MLVNASIMGVGYDYNKVKKWMVRDCRGEKTIAKTELICLPVKMGADHWVLIVIDARAQEFVVMDSFSDAKQVQKIMFKDNSKNSTTEDVPDDERVDLLETAQKWYKDEYRRQTGEEKDISSWGVVYNPCYYPRQIDMHSCGIFVMYMMDYFEVMRYPDFVNKDAKLLRKRAALFISNNALPDS